MQRFNNYELRIPDEQIENNKQQVKDGDKLIDLIEATTISLVMKNRSMIMRSLIHLLRCSG